MALPAALRCKPGKTYAATVWVRANRPGTLVEVNLLEVVRGRRYATDTVGIVLGGAWQRVEVTHQTLAGRRDMVGGIVRLVTGGNLTTYASGMRWRRVAQRLPLTGVAVAGAVAGHMVAYVLAVPSPTVRVVLLGATGHAYWTAAIAAAVVLGLASLAATLGRRFQAGLLAGRPEPGERLGRVAAQLAGFQVAIYLVQETLERLEVGIPVHALLDGRLLVTGVIVQSAVALALAVLLTLAGRVAEAAGRALRGPARHLERTGRPLPGLVVVAWPSRLLAAGRGSRAPPCSLVAR